MLKMYIKNGCPYCAMVLAKIDDLELDVQLLNVADDGIIDELIEKGGRKMVPYFVDEEKGIGMYESADITGYLDKNYGKESPQEEAVADADSSSVE